MKKFLLNKYTISCIIVLLIVGVDIVLHKGMSRVMVTDTFTEQRTARSFEVCKQPLLSTNKRWVKAVNTVSNLQTLDSSTAGIEMDVYFDTLANTFFVYHDSDAISTLSIKSILDAWSAKKMKGSIWLDFKNLAAQNKLQALLYLRKLRDQYQLKNKIIVEASSPGYLHVFCKEGFFTSYYVPFFNPYNMSEKELMLTVDEIATQLAAHKVSALSGYYFQYPFLKKYFPDYPILTWTEGSAISIVANYFNSNLLNDPQVAVVLFPQ